jgi:hypothetical protein
MSSPVLAALARLQAGTSETPIYDQLVIQHAARRLTEDLRPAMETFRRGMETIGHNVASWMARVRQAQELQAARMAPEAVLDRIRSDQASLDWREAWAAERERQQTVAAYWRAAELRRELGDPEWWVQP